ncbi:MAG TPA: hypothetical protein VD835_19650 [Pyrinomonadaceae bacterium]|nr:hypothetical protein [Pyrinomonadaceae bacterium]
MKTTAKHFEEFKRYHAEYLSRYGLYQWRCEYRHGELENCYAETEMAFAGKCATVTFATRWTKTRPLNSAELKKLAKHEVNHTLLYSLYWHATARYIQPDTLNEAEEAIVRTLDQLIPD